MEETQSTNHEIIKTNQMYIFSDQIYLHDVVDCDIYHPDIDHEAPINPFTAPEVRNLVIYVYPCLQDTLYGISSTGCRDLTVRL